MSTNNQMFASLDLHFITIILSWWNSKRCIRQVRIRVQVPQSLYLQNSINSRFLHGDLPAIKYFYSNDLSKKNLFRLAKCTRLTQTINKFKNDEYIKEMLEICVYRKSEDFLTSKISFQDFFKLLFDRQSKHTWIFQDILNSISSFEQFFVFNNLRKTISKTKKA